MKTYLISWTRGFGFAAILLFFWASIPGCIQSQVMPDSVLSGSIPMVNQPDSVQSDSVRMQTGSRSDSDLEGPIIYQARVIENFVQDKKTILTGKAKVEYLEMSLSAARIEVNWDSREMIAEGSPDSVWTVNSQGDSVRTLQLTGNPEFSEAGDVMVGEQMTYNIKTRKAFVLRGRTEYDAGYYNGQAMKLVGKDKIYVGDAEFTTCDKPVDSHFHFWSRQMKIMINNKVIAKPVVMYLGHIPVMALPFAMFPIKKGRHSGLLIPRYGESSTEGRSLRGLGYYWAPSQYWDAKTAVNYYEKAGFLFRGDIRYNKRYALRGNISGSITRKDFETNQQKVRRWDLRVNHDQEISPTARLTVNANLISSDNLYRDVSANPMQRLQGNITSNATLTKRIGRSGNLTVNLNQNRNIRRDTTEAALKAPHISETMPQVSFSNRWSNLIPQKKRGLKQAWYQQITLPYNVRFAGQRKRIKYREGYGETEKEDGLGVNHSLSLYVAPKLFGWLNLQPQISYSEVWMDRRNTFLLNNETNEIEENEERGFFAVRTYSSSVTANTKLYGLFRSRVVPDVQLRHVVTPAVSFTYQPDFTREKWGYFINVADTSGRIYKKNPYSGQVMSPSIGTEQQSMNFSVNNVVQMKKGDGENAKKTDLFTYNLTSAYNWKDETNRLKDLRSRFTAKLFRNYNLSISSTHTFYKSDSLGRLTNDQYFSDIRWTDWQSLTKARLARMTNMSMNLSFSLKGKSGQQKKSPTGATSGSPFSSFQDENRMEFMDNGEDPLLDPVGDRYEMEDEFTALNMPWNLRSTITYSNNFRGSSASKKFYTDLNLDFNLTQNWKVSCRTRLDLDQKKFMSQDFTIYRDLHCWEARINWTPIGYKRFYLRINVKSSMLKDIKVEKGRGRQGYFSY